MSNTLSEDEKFSVTQFFSNGTHETVREFVSLPEAWSAFQHYTNSVAVRLGFVNRVIITDMLDCTNVDWVAGKGIVFPTREDIAKMQAEPEEKKE